MNINIVYSQNHEGYESQDMLIKDRQGTTGVTVLPLCECPEDAIIGRSLTSCAEIAELMERAYNAGVLGEGFTLTHEDD